MIEKSQMTPKKKKTKLRTKLTEIFKGNEDGKISKSKRNYTFTEEKFNKSLEKRKRETIKYEIDLKESKKNTLFFKKPITRYLSGEKGNEIKNDNFKEKKEINWIDIEESNKNRNKYGLLTKESMIELSQKMKKLSFVGDLEKFFNNMSKLLSRPKTITFRDFERCQSLSETALNQTKKHILEIEERYTTTDNVQIRVGERGIIKAGKISDYSEVGETGRATINKEEETSLKSFLSSFLDNDERQRKNQNKLSKNFRNSLALTSTEKERPLYVGLLMDNLCFLETLNTDFKRKSEIMHFDTNMFNTSNLKSNGGKSRFVDTELPDDHDFTRHFSFSILSLYSHQHSDNGTNFVGGTSEDFLVTDSGEYVDYGRNFSNPFLHYKVEKKKLHKNYVLVLRLIYGTANIEKTPKNWLPPVAIFSSNNSMPSLNNSNRYLPMSESKDRFRSTRNISISNNSYLQPRLLEAEISDLSSEFLNLAFKFPIKSENVPDDDELKNSVVLINKSKIMSPKQQHPLKPKNISRRLFFDSDNFHSSSSSFGSFCTRSNSTPNYNQTTVFLSKNSIDSFHNTMNFHSSKLKYTDDQLELVNFTHMNTHDEKSDTFNSSFFVKKSKDNISNLFLMNPDIEIEHE